MSDSPFFSHEAERAVVSLLLFHQKYARYASQLSTEDFHDVDCKALFGIVHSLIATGKQVSALTVFEELQRGTGDDAPLQRASEWNLRYSLEGYAIRSHIEKIRSCRLRRDLYAALEDAERMLADSEADTAVVLDRTRQQLRDLIVTGHEWQTMTDVLLATYDKLERKAKGEEKPISSGIGVLDKLTCGFHKGELTVIGARPAVGKSALGMYAALSAARQGHKVGVISLEMTDDQYGTRVLGSASNLVTGKLRGGNLDPADWDALADAMACYGNLDIRFQFNVRRIEDLRMEVQKLVDSHGLDLLVIDYLQLCQSHVKGQKDFERIGYVSRSIKQMSTDYKIAIIALAQVGRSADGSMPSLSELRGSGEIEQDADNVIFLHRCESANDQYVRPEHRGAFCMLKEKELQYMVINVAKQRQGQIGMMPVIFNPAKMLFSKLEVT